MTGDLAHIHAITLTVPAEFAGQPLLHLVQAAVGAEIAGELFAHGGVWLERRRYGSTGSPAGTVVCRSTPACSSSASMDL